MDKVVKIDIPHKYLVHLHYVDSAIYNNDGIAVRVYFFDYNTTKSFNKQFYVSEISERNLFTYFGLNDITSRIISLCIRIGINDELGINVAKIVQTNVKKMMILKDGV